MVSKIQQMKFSRTKVSLVREITDQAVC